MILRELFANQSLYQLAKQEFKDDLPRPVWDEIIGLDTTKSKDFVYFLCKYGLMMRDARTQQDRDYIFGLLKRFTDNIHFFCQKYDSLLQGKRIPKNTKDSDLREIMESILENSAPEVHSFEKNIHKAKEGVDYGKLYQDEKWFLAVPYNPLGSRAVGGMTDSKFPCAWCTLHEVKWKDHWPNNYLIYAINLQDPAEKWAFQYDSSTGELLLVWDINNKSYQRCPNMNVAWLAHQNEDKAHQLALSHMNKIGGLIPRGQPVD